MKKFIFTLVIAFLTSIALNLPSSAVTVAAPGSSTAVQADYYSAKGDKILDYYENLADKTPENKNKYLTAAKYYYYQANRLDISNQNALIGRARIALIEDRIRDAKNNLLMALNFNEDNPKVNYYLGEAFFKDGEYTQAIDFYTHAYTHGYKLNYKTNLKLGICYEKLNDVPRATYHYQNASKISPNQTEAQARLGAIAAVKTDYTKYNEELEKQQNIEEPIDETDLSILNKSTEKPAEESKKVPEVQQPQPVKEVQYIKLPNIEMPEFNTL